MLVKNATTIVLSTTNTNSVVTSAEAFLWERFVMGNLDRIGAERRKTASGSPKGERSESINRIYKISGMYFSDLGIF